MVLRTLKQKFQTFYFLKIKKLSLSDYYILRMREAGITVGENCKIYTYVQSAEPTLIKIGNNVTISTNISFCSHDNAIIKVLDNATDVVGSITVGDNCFIGMNSILMYGIELGDTCVVGAGSVVTHSFPPHSVIAGNPARRICSTEDYAEKNKDYAIDFSNIPYSEKAEFFETHPDKIIRKPL